MNEIPEHIHRLLDDVARNHADFLDALDDPDITIEDLEARFGVRRLDLDELRKEYGQ